MISRRTTISLAEAYVEKFLLKRFRRSMVMADALYEFLYEHEFPQWFCTSVTQYSNPRGLKQCIMQIHTGNTLSSVTKSLNWKEREELGQQHLRDLTEAILNDFENNPSHYTPKKTAKILRLIRNLELDGYIFSNSRLLIPERNLLNGKGEAGLLHSLYSTLSLDNKQAVFHYLTLSEQHYLDGKWDDSVSNSRKFLESVLREVAAAHSLRKNEAALARSTLMNPTRVCNYLEKENLLERNEKEALTSTYELLNRAGGHPYMRVNDQARLMRHLALTFSQFVMLRFHGCLTTKP